MRHFTKTWLSIATLTLSPWAVAGDLTGTAYNASGWNTFCAVSGGVTTPASCTMRPHSQLVRIYKVGVCAGKPVAPTTGSAVDFTGKGCSTMYDSAAGQVVDYSAAATTLTGSVNPANGTYSYLYLEVGALSQFKASLQLPTGQVGGVYVDNPGSTYSTASPPTVSFSGGGCTSLPSATVQINSANEIGMIWLTGVGAGCTSAPTVTISGGGSGGGAAATAHMGGVSTAGSGSTVTSGAYCWTKSGADSTTFYNYADWDNPWTQPNVIECGSSLPAQSAMGYNTVRWNGFGGDSFITNAPVSDGTASGAGRVNAMDVYVLKSDGRLPGAIALNSANDIEKVSGILTLPSAVTYSGTGTPTLGFNNSRGAKVETLTYTPFGGGGPYQSGVILRFLGGPIDATFTVR